MICKNLYIHFILFIGLTRLEWWIICSHVCKQQNLMSGVALSKPSTLWSSSLKMAHLRSCSNWDARSTKFRVLATSSFQREALIKESVWEIKLRWLVICSILKSSWWGKELRLLSIGKSSTQVQGLPRSRQGLMAVIQVTVEVHTVAWAVVVHLMAVARSNMAVLQTNTVVEVVAEAMAA